jgi:hypothetical protein
MMPRYSNIRIAHVLAVGVLGVATTAARAFDLSPGTLVGLDIAGGNGEIVHLVEYLPNGTISEMLRIPPISDNGFVSGLAVFGSLVFVSDTDNFVARINLANGQIMYRFPVAAQQTDSLGNIGPDLLVGDFFSNVVRRVNMNGDPVGTITLAGPTLAIEGIDSDGSRIFAGSYHTGDIHIFDVNGNPVGLIDANLGSHAISALGYDPASDSVWVATSFSTDEIRGYSVSTGQLLTAFPAQRGGISGLDVVPPIPEPLGAGAVGMMGAGVALRRVKHSRPASNAS